MELFKVYDKLNDLEAVESLQYYIDDSSWNFKSTGVRMPNFPNTWVMTPQGALGLIHEDTKELFVADWERFDIVFPTDPRWALMVFDEQAKLEDKVRKELIGP